MNAAPRTAIPVLLALLAPEAHATICTNTSRGNLACDGTVKSGQISRNGTNAFTSYTCDVTDPGGNLVTHDGPDAIYRLVCPYTGVVTLRVESDCEVDAFVLDTCAGSDCLYGWDETGDSRTIAVNCIQNDERWVVLEAWNLIHGPFGYWCGTALQASATYQTWIECPEDCADGQDDDHDGLVDLADPDCCDLDDDGYDATHAARAACSGTDCDDNNATVRPGGVEVPGNGIDENCNGKDQCFRDDDGDGYGSTLTIAGLDMTCDEPGRVSTNTDCDDTLSSVNPNATETVGNGIDENCNGTEICYDDDDDDGFLDTTNDTRSSADVDCTDPFEGTSSDPKTDCDDTTASRSPVATEICNGVDDDCDGLIDDADPNLSGGTLWYRDVDGDGAAGSASTLRRCVQPAGYYATTTDCNDSSNTIYPGATEVPADGVDQNCDGVDTCYVDNDRDGFGGTVTAAGNDLTCGNVAGESATNTDCNDAQAAIKPTATEICNSTDDDCDGLVDDADPSRSGGTTWYLDADRDGHAGSATTAQRCLQPAGYYAQATDCDDANAAAYPQAAEIPADRIDQDCNGVDTCYIDADRDGFGGASTAPGDDMTCGNLAGEAATNADCADNNNQIYPTQTETCNGVDDDCDGRIDDADDGRVGGTVFYRDLDGDGFAGPDATVQACTQPVGAYTQPRDCLDQPGAGAAFYPGAPEVPADGLDQDCDGVDHCYVDQDRDGFGTLFAAPGNNLTCGDVSGESDTSTDCRDTGPGAAQVFPGAAEVCNSVDDDCDGLVDDADADRTGGSLWYLDADADGYAGSATTTQSCLQPAGYFASSTDCLDTGPLGPSVHPGAQEIPADSFDQDCDGTDHCYVDQDGDGYGTALAAAGDDMTCGNTPGESDTRTDCADVGAGAASIFPGAVETCNGYDDDCDTLIDDADPDRTGGSVWFGDNDGDGYAGSVVTRQACAQPNGFSAAPIDCLDSGPLGPTFNPGATDTPADGFDQDCDGVDDCWVDLDGDGYGSDGAAAGDNLVCGDQPGESDNADDCVDVGEGAAEINPGAVELCNGIDDDCDLIADDGAIGGPTWYLDQDHDGYAGRAITVSTCTQPAGYYAAPDDCLDVGPLAPDYHPGATENVGDGLDQDCDGVDQCWADLDGDGYGGGSTIPGDNLVCGDIPGEAATSTDCLDQGDGARQVHPGAPEVCNGYDDDCDTLIDDRDADRTGGSVWYLDADGDGYAGSATTQQSCAAPQGGGYYAEATDCRDAGPDATSFHPGATEVVGDGLDQDCDRVDDCWVDLDGDGYGSRTSAPGDNLVCGDHAGESTRGDDCLDEGPGAARVFPDAAEVCNGYDDDCDARVDDADDNVTGAPTWYRDRDGDGAAGNTATTSRCVAPPDFYDRATDCDDARTDIGPDAPELCNGYDDDCDGLIDDADVVTGTITVWRDADGDGFGDATAPRQVASCATPPGAADNADDCDDRDETRFPGATEVPYDQIDQDCVGGDLVDIDGDGYAGGGFGDDCVDTVPAIHPGQPERPDGVDDDCNDLVDDRTSRYDDDGDGVAEEGGDCNDADRDIQPGAVERCDGVDQDCDGQIDEHTTCSDDDQDGFTERQGDCNDADPAVHPSAAEQGASGVDNNCDGALVAGDADGDGYAPWGGDCDDGDADVHPGAEERPNGADDDCDLTVDEGTVIHDDDHDGFTEAAGDCDDAEPLVNPGAVEVPTNRRDDDCDSVVDEGGLQVDDDGDGFTEDAGDCNDGDATVRPYGEEVDDSRDNDCDGQIDEGIGDVDGDGWTAADGDCDDADGYAHPDMDEACDGVDNDCDSAVDEGCAGRDDDTGGKDPGSEGTGCTCSHTGTPPLAAAALLLLALRRRR